MKRKKANVYRMMTIIILFCGITLFSKEVNAQQPAKQVTETEGSLSVNYLGREDGYLAFAVILNNTPEKRSTLTISDHDGHEMFKEFINSPVFAKKMLFRPEDVEAVSFSMVTPGSRIKKVFSVEHQFTETFQVKELENK